MLTYEFKAVKCKIKARVEMEWPSSSQGSSLGDLYVISSKSQNRKCVRVSETIWLH